jgi:signal peptidase II
MMERKNKMWWIAAFTVAFVLLVDQWVKFYVKTHFAIGDQYDVTSWFKIHFVENEGMAFGWKLGPSGTWGKLVLSLFRIVAVFFIGRFIVRLIKTDATPGLVFCLSLIFAGAIGNILDSLYFGRIFSASTPFDIATLFPKGGGYANILHGKVVDMLYFPLFEGYLPKWLGGGYFTFFDPVFNIADASISVGVALMLLFHRSIFDNNKEEELNLSENEESNIALNNQESTELTNA